MGNVSDCDDSSVVVKALERPTPVIDIMAAGTAMRFLTAYLSVGEGEHVITGTERMRHRPIGILVDALRSLGADIGYEEEEGFPPLRIKGRKLSGGEVSLSGQVSSQYVSALMMIAPVMELGLSLHLVGDIVSRPYIEMTAEMMREFGATVEWADEATIRVAPGGYRPMEYTVENDWSGASYWYEKVAIDGGGLLLPGLRENSLQGDSRVKDFFKAFCVETEFVNEGALIRRTGQTDTTKPLLLDLVEQPDLAQTLVCTCAFVGKPFRFTGLQSLKIKETDRIHALRTELAKLGYDVREEDGSVLFWDGAGKEVRPESTGAVAIDTYDDHRMAMSFAFACLRFGDIVINAPEVVSKSYPSFWDNWRE